MNWNDFILYLALAYVAYYGLILIIDLLKPSSKLATSVEGDILEFSEEDETVIIEEDEPVIQRASFENVQEGNTSMETWINREEDSEEIELVDVNVNNSTGGVTQIGELFSLAQEDSIEVTKKLVFS
tara:strand:+ start:1898 stop:2278 length:381 start_codon:yes stop_codon:yes gene_type:complete